MSLLISMDKCLPLGVVLQIVICTFHSRIKAAYGKKSAESYKACKKCKTHLQYKNLKIGLRKPLCFLLMPLSGI